MSNQWNKALSAARSLAKALALPSTRGSVYAWHDSTGDRIVVSVDRRWLETNRTLPAMFDGFPVVHEDNIGAAAHRRPLAAHRLQA